jgi:hypothetical protein
LFLCNFSGIEIGCLLKLLNYTNGLLRYISKELQWRKFCQASLKTMLREGTGGKKGSECREKAEFSA